MKARIVLGTLCITLLALSSAIAQWPPPQAPAIPEADGYVTIPNVAMPPQKTRTYRAIFDATQSAEKPTQLVPALNMAGSELNALLASNIPLTNAKFVVVFHGAAIDGILDEVHYRRKFGVSNPNIKVIAALKKAGTEVFVCGQNLAFARIDPKTLMPGVRVASDALIVLMAYQNDGYALLSF